MDQLSQARLELREMDALAGMNSPVHRLHPLCKLLVTIFYIGTVTSFPKYSLSALMAMVLYPAVMFSAAGIPLSLCFRRLRFVLPLVWAVGLANPFLDRTPLLRLGGMAVTGGMLARVTLMLKGTLALTASFLLLATTPVDRLCACLRRVHVPAIITTLLLLTYRYVGLMLEEASAMFQAYSLRAPGHRGVHVSAWGSFLGQLLLRSMDRAEELCRSMELRGFHGEFYCAAPPRWRGWDAACVVLWPAAFLLARRVNAAVWLGGLIVR